MLAYPCAIGAIQQDPIRRVFKQASLDLQFAERKSLVDATTGSNLVDFTRSTGGTYVGSDGLIKTAVVNEPRFDHDPVTGESLGLLVEEQRTNLLQRTEEFDQSPWSVSSVTIVPNTSAAPNGAQTADTLDWSSGTAVVSQAITKAASPVTYTASLFVKSVVTSFSLTVDDGGTVNRGRVVFDLSTGTKTAEVNDGSGFSGTTGSVISYPNGWLKITLTTTTNSTTTARFRVFWSDGDVVTWGAQLEAGAFATSYIKNVDAALGVTRAADTASISSSNFSGWYSENAGTFYTHHKAQTGSLVVVADDGSFANRYPQISVGSFSENAINYVSSTSVVASFNTGVSTDLTRVATSYSLDDFAAVRDGATVLTDSSGALASGVNTLRIGALFNGTAAMDGHIRRLTYWNKRLPGSTLQAITQ
jgi:X-X-X-Leu-X-X-Gly heptad repeat protein